MTSTDSVNHRIVARVSQWLLLAALATLVGCASTVPDPIRNAPPQDVRASAVRSAPDQFRGTSVRWGGSIVAVRNLKDETIIEMVSRRLESDGRPTREDYTDGRFLAYVVGFLDPEVYAAGREVTVSGRLRGTETRAIGEHTYVYPVVRVEQIYLWEKPAPASRYSDYDPYWANPWDPWYPWGHWGWPYYRPWPR